MTAVAKNIRLKREDWLEIGLRELSRRGPKALRVDDLCRAARKTKGSFYHHFADAEAFRSEMFEHWRQRHTERLIAEVDGHDDPTDRRKVLNRLASDLDQSIENALRRMAVADPAAGAAVSGADERRIDYLARINRDEFGAGRADARDLAEIEYAMFVGYQILFPDVGTDRLMAVQRLFDVMVQAGGEKTGRHRPVRKGR